jgi:hypothetical protein
MQLTLNLARLQEYSRQTSGYPAELETLNISKLEGGLVAGGVYRHDLTFRLANGSRETISVVQKFSSSNEVRVMQLLNEMPTIEAVPRLIDAAIDLSTADLWTNWLITPYYEGVELTFDDDVPLPVLESLARIHTYFAPRAGQLSWLPQVNADFFRAICDNALAVLDQTLAEKPHPVFAEARSYVVWVRELPALYEALEVLPVTLTHRDVHPGNIIHTLDGSSILFDWGNACLAPAMLDLANMVKRGSPGWFHYLASWEAAAGQPADLAQAGLGFDWATVMVNLQYLPYAIAYRPPERVQEMVDLLLAAVKRIETGGEPV